MSKILLIEDNTEMRENTSEILSFAKFTVVTAENGRVGVEKAKRENPDLIICDVMMPDMDGYEVLQMLSRNPETAGVPFIFLTAKADKGDVRKGMNLGADDYITKPFDETELIHAIEVRLKRSNSFRKNYSPDVVGLTQFISEAKKFSLPASIASECKIRTFSKKEALYEEGDNPSTEKDMAHHPYIRKKLAKAIYDYRKENGGFKDIKEIIKVDGMDNEVYSKLSAYLSITK